MAFAQDVIETLERRTGYLRLCCEPPVLSARNDLSMGDRLIDDVVTCHNAGH